MKGIIFTEFFEFVISVHGENMVDDIIDDCDLSTNGAYTSVGTYDHTELLQLVSALSKRTDTPIPNLVYGYGHHIFPRLYGLLPLSIKPANNAFDFLERVHGVVHEVEVKKLYPDAKLPTFITVRPTHNTLVMTYQSVCPFADLAHGLMAGCINHFNEDITITSQDKNTNEHYSRIFTLTKNDG